MDNIRKSIEILFKIQNPETILEKYFSPLNDLICSENIDRDNFHSFFSFQHKNLYNKDEVYNVVDLLEKNWNKYPIVKKDSFFNVLAKFTQKVLVEHNGEPVCDYQNLLRWREISHQLGEDLFTSSYFAMKDFEIGRTRTKFAWRPIVSTNNIRIRELLKKGLAENHFHLKGSAPHFQLNWLSLMNNTCDRNEEFEWLYTKEKMLPNLNMNFKESNQDFKLLIVKAAAIRYYLAKKYILEEIHFDKKEWEVIKKILKSKDNLEVEILKKDLDTNIETLKYLKGKRFEEEIPDYMICKNITENNYNFKSKHYNGNILLYGERKFLYNILKKIYSGDKELEKEKDLLYVYILIKQKFRAEIIQNNQKVGFGNFSDYQDRKGIFLNKSKIYKKAVINMAINSSMIDQNIKFLEARIAPEKTFNDYNDIITLYDSYTKSKEFYDIKDDNLDRLIQLNKKENILKGEHFYNIHFIKIPEFISQKKEAIYELELFPRNNNLRIIIKKQALELNKFRKSGYENAERILGIDAANTEIGCRPEVFGQTFRYLKSYSYEDPLHLFGMSKFKELGISYHVGEEFLDLADGLRAIDEAIRFLNLTYGDRLGHALALGVCPEKYYESKGYTIISPKQDLLDNIVWLIAKIREYNVNTSTTFINTLENKYRKYLSEIYLDDFGYSYHDYYESWKLRGDSPEIYQKIMGKDNYQINENIFPFWEKCGLNNHEDTQIARKNRNAVKLYQKYHFDAIVKQNGSIVDEFKIESEYINIIKKIQIKLQEEVGRRNIFIETNPSSNYLIGTIKKYSEHPILNFYNLGLGNSCDCHQISVSINTDDQGVFSTYLENEYALMALALEKQKDDVGNYIYNQTMIYEWLDKIRQMGLEQSFINRNQNSYL